MVISWQINNLGSKINIRTIIDSLALAAFYSQLERFCMILILTTSKFALIYRGCVSWGRYFTNNCSIFFALRAAKTLLTL